MCVCVRYGWPYNLSIRIVRLNFNTDCSFVRVHTHTNHGGSQTVADGMRDFVRALSHARISMLSLRSFAGELAASECVCVCVCQLTDAYMCVCLCVCVCRQNKVFVFVPLILIALPV